MSAKSIEKVQCSGYMDKLHIYSYLNFSELGTFN